MNKKVLLSALRKGKHLRLRPIPKRADGQGKPLPSEDDFWTGTGNQSPSSVELHNTRTGHKWTLGFDNIREFRTPDFLILRGQLGIKGGTIDFEPSAGTQKGAELLAVTLTGAVLSGGTCTVARAGCEGKAPGSIVTQVNAGHQVISVCHRCLATQLESGDWYSEDAQPYRNP